MSLKHDYQPPRSSFQNNERHLSRHRFLTIIVGLVLCGVIALFFFGGSPTPETEARTAPVEISAPPVEPLPPQPVRHEIRNLVQPGETITSLLGDFFSPQEILSLSKESKDVFPFTRICAGQPYRICTTDGQFESFTYEIDDEEQLLIHRASEDTRIERVPIEYQVKTELVEGVIKTSLFDAVTEVGEDPELAIALADIFAWDIDFILDLRVGDTFQALVEKRFREGKKAGYGKILAAEFVNQKRTFQAVLFQDGGNRPSYYDADGQNVRKAFLKAPLDFTRISSGFTMKRFHPITKTWRAHPAIDYAAPPGTPIKAVGDATITRIGYTRGNGNFVELRHTGGYTTMYLHMRKFARGMRKGKRVDQGQVIGYVGSTGLATGPHLCFRMKKNGAPVNPFHVKAPAAAAVSKAHLTEFKALSRPLLAQFEENRNQIKTAGLPPSEGSPVLQNPSGPEPTR